MQGLGDHVGTVIAESFHYFQRLGPDGLAVEDAPATAERLGTRLTQLVHGVESLSYPMLALGAAGVMNAVGNLLPEAVAALCDAVEAGDHDKALRLHRKLFGLNQAIFFDTNPVPLKRMLSRVRLTSEEVRPPLAPLDSPTRRAVDAVLAEALADDALAGAGPVRYPA